MKAVRRLALASLALPALLLACLTFSSPALAAGCPNEQLRSESAVNPATGLPYSAALPDCRAYELVTPASGKHGGSAAGVRAVAAGGDVAIFNVNTAFAESDGAPVESLYEAQRGAAGWAAIARNAPAVASKNAETARVPVSGNASELLFLFGNSLAVEPEEFAIGLPNGQLAGTLPLAHPVEARFTGASATFSTIVFENYDTAPLLPAASNEDKGIDVSYEVIDVRGASPALALLGVNDSGDLITDCRVSLGSSQESGAAGGAQVSDFHAISESGAMVYVEVEGHSEPGCASSIPAPAVNELYAQIDGTQAVAVSEPSAADCSACDTSPGAQKNAVFQGASADGSKVFFTTQQELLSGQTTENLYGYDFDAEAGHKISLVSAGSAEPNVQGVVRISDDGSHVYFVAKGVLTQGENAEGNEPVAGGDNLYVFERDAAYPNGRTQFIGTLLSADAGLWGLDAARLAQSTPDGQFLVFDSFASLTPGKTSAAQAVYLYDATTGHLVRASIGQDGYDNNGNNDAYNATIGSDLHFERESPSEDTSDVGAVSEDGSYVFFDSPEALTPSAIGGVEHVYEYHEGQVYLISDGQDQAGATFARATLSGSDVFFTSNDALVRQDENPGTENIYDARVDGGFSAPALAAPPCSGEACQGTLSPAPLFQSSASATFTGGANVPPGTQTKPPSTQTKPPIKALTRVQKLAKALKTCKAKHNKKRRAACQRQAHKRYAPRTKAKKKAKQTDRRVR